MSVRSVSRGPTLLERWRADWVILVLVLPGFLYFVVFSYLPLFGFTQSDWVGLDNFRQMFSDPRFWNAVTNTLVIAGLQLLLYFPAPIVLAIIIHSLVSVRVRRLVQSVVYLPHF